MAFVSSKATYSAVNRLSQVDVDGDKVVVASSDAGGPVPVRLAGQALKAEDRVKVSFTLTLGKAGPRIECQH